MKKEFETIKEEILFLATEKGACEEGICDAENAKTPEELLEVIKKYCGWLNKEKVINVDWLAENFETNFLYDNGIYLTGNHIINDAKGVYTTWGSSSATVETWGSSSKLNYSIGKDTRGSVKDLNKNQIHVSFRTWKNIMKQEYLVGEFLKLFRMISAKQKQYNYSNK